MSFLSGYYDNNKRQDLEKQRAETLKGIKIANDTNENNLDRKKQQQQYQDEKRNEMIERVKNQYKEISTQNIDNGIERALRGDYEPLKSILTNNTDSNVNRDIKATLEHDIGGKIIDVKHPDPTNLAEGEEYAPDEVAIEILTDAGERQVHTLSVAQLGAMVGTHNRIGADKYHELSSGRYKNVSNTGKAILDSIGFDGNVKNIQSSLALMATLGKDLKSAQLLNTIRETTAKDGEELLKTLTAEYGNAETPEEKATLTSKIKDVYEMVQATQKKTIKAPKQLSQKDQLISDYRTATKEGRNSDAQNIWSTYEKFYGKGAKINQKQQEAEAQRAMQSEAYDNLVKDFSTDNIYNAKGEVAPESIEHLQSYLNTLKTDGQRNAVVRQLASKLISQDMRKDKSLDVTSEKLRLGKVDEKANNMLKALKKLEQADTALVSNSRYKDAKKTVDSAIYTLKNANTIKEEYDQAVNKGLFKGVEASGVVTSLRQNISKWVGDIVGSDEEIDSKVKANINTTISKLDQYDKLKRKTKLSDGEKDKLDSIAKDLQIDKTQQWKTDTYIVLKKMLQSISGMGVTNQELESFKQAFSGDDKAMLDYMTNQLTYSAGAMMKVANTEYKNLSSMGAIYTATDSILRMREAGSYIIENGNLDVNANIDNKPSFKSDFEALHPEKFEKFKSVVATKLHINKATVSSIVDKVVDAMNSGDNMASILRRNPMLDPKQVKAVLKAYQVSFNAIPQEQPSQQPTQQVEPTLPSDEDMLKKISDKESGGDYHATSETSSAYGKYQMTKGTLEGLAKKMNTSVSALKTREGQEKAMKVLLEDHKKNLASYKVQPTEENIYTIHQLGAGRAKRYFKGTLTSDDIRIMYNNLPSEDKKKTTNKDRETVLKLWNDKYRGGLDGYDTV